jgi:multiple sugar transport system permease protein
MFNNLPSLVIRDPVPIRQWVLLAIGLVIASFYLFPVYWMLVSALKTADEVNAAIPSMFPKEPTLNAFRWIFERENVGRYLANSFFIAGTTTLLTLLLSTGAAYTLSRIRSKWMDAILIFVMLTQVLPPPLLVTPMFVIFRQLDLVNTYTAVILATTSKTLPFAIIMLRTTFAQIPVEIEEAARVDGCSRLIAFIKITMPLARVGYIVVGSLVFLLAYGEFVYPVSLMNKQSLQPATVGLFGFVGADYSDWGNAMAFASVMVLPVLIIFVALQKHIVSGLTSGALK